MCRVPLCWSVNYITASLSEVNKYRGLTEPPTPPGSRWRYIVAESNVQVEPSTPRASQPPHSPLGLEDIQSPVAATKGAPVEGERRRTLEDVVMEEASTAVTSVYDQHFSTSFQHTQAPYDYYIRLTLLRPRPPSPIRDRC